MNDNQQAEITQRMEMERRLYEYQGEDEVIDSHEALARCDNKNPVSRILSTLPTLDREIGGFHGGELTVVSGPTGNGEALTCQSLTKSFYDQGHRCLWFSYEVQTRQFLQQFGDPLPSFYLPNALRSNTLQWIYERIMEAKLKYNIEAVFVDHLHFIADVMIKKNPSLEIGQVMRTLKRWALEFNVSFFLIAHTTKIKVETEPDLGDTRDSSFIEQESDNVFYVWRKLKVENGATLKIAKNRRNGVFGKKIDLIKKGKFLTEPEGASR